MTSGEEYTFSELMGILTNMEEKISKFYEKIAQKIGDTELKDLFLSFSKKALQQKDSLTETRRRTVTEMTLETITGLKLSEKLAKIDSVIEREEVELSKLLELEDLLSGLYKTVSKRVAHISADVSFLLDNFSREHRRRKRSIEKTK